MSRALSRSMVLLCLLPWLAGCATFGSGSIPTESRTLGVVAQDRAVQDMIRKGHGAQADVFVPLAQAEAAVAAARAQPGIDDHGADLLAQARTQLAKAQQLWALARDNGESNTEQLLAIETRAHDARRLAQIARFTTLRETNLAQLKADTAQARQLRAAGQTGADGAGLVGARVVPDRLGALTFDLGEARLDAAAGQVVTRLATLLKSHPDVGVVILGHTDNSQPSPQSMQRFKSDNPQLEDRDLSQQQLVYGYHVALSNARARIVARALVAAGIAPRRIGAKGYGSTRPVAGNDTAAGRAANRRVVAVIVPGPDDRNSPLYKPAE